MGVCLGKDSDDPDRQTDKKISQGIRQDKRIRDREIKLLLLGAGESGKSTIFKQMKIIMEDGYKEEECLRFKEVIYGNTIQCIRNLINAVNRLQIGFENDQNKERADRLASIPEQQIILNAGSLITPEVGEDIKELWKDSGIQRAYDRRNEFQLLDSAAYFLDDIDRIASPEYQPSQQDVLRSRVKTVGIVETEFTIEGYKFRMVDVGGQRNERRKWIHVFDNVTAIIFVTSLSEYDLMLFEDDKMNRMRESLVLFDEICNSRYFKSTSVILFLNKSDLFKKKIQHTDLKVCFSEYEGGCNYDAAIEFLEQKFRELDKSNQREIYTHVTCATDTDNIKKVFDDVKSILLHSILESSELV
eukprot:gb/GECH01014601.1/.p1 GENE.gb/GECH01014601.1/~~gb/GECH01014601.1/.p1  ORF type:complete len:359 (+),score=84.59 gb/GECH01014601.1/:1-1077(+)